MILKSKLERHSQNNVKKPWSSKSHRHPRNEREQKRKAQTTYPLLFPPPLFLPKSLRFHAENKRRRKKNDKTYSPREKIRGEEGKNATELRKRRREGKKLKKPTTCCREKSSLEEISEAGDSAKERVANRKAEAVVRELGSSGAGPLPRRT
ncbi:hypothetical protein AVEN_5608-1 [Araneus ventricosus]|uniref:Uncharacterized protein n=1 Tax=Araneus ventricosus TaxID=182803 RepID=A0A4Y2MJ21_ARAVE|nr:hypothetical protein AVEN_5608-1 [Araneus ventricosus]